VLTVGGEGHPDYEFVRIQVGLRTPSGTLVIADAQTPEIRIFGPDGRLIRKLGRNGEGPGEFRRIGSLFLNADTIITYDGALRRLTWYSLNGALLRTAPFTYPPEAGYLSITGRLQSGRWVVTTGHSPGWEHGSGTYRDTTRVGLWAAGATGPIQWVGQFPGMTFLVHAPPGDKADWTVGMLPLSPLGQVATWRDTLLAGDTGTPELTYYAPDGHRLRSVSLPAALQPLATDAVRAAQRDALDNARQKREKIWVRLSYEVALKSTARRIWDGLVVADDGRLWVGVPEGDPHLPSRYLVLGPDGGVVGSWRLPTAGRILSVSNSHLVVAARDAEDVERVVVIRVAARDLH
jgi:hypothetical protein